MDTETLWILRKLAAGEISAQLADRILRALALLRKTEESKSTDDLALAEQKASEKTLPARQQAIPWEAEPSTTADAAVVIQDKLVEAGVVKDTEESSPAVASVEGESALEAQIQEATELQKPEPSLEMMAEEVQKFKESDPESAPWPEKTDERPLLGEDGVGIIEDVPDGIELLLEKAGNIVIQGWNQNHIRAEGKVDSSTVLRTEKSLKIGSENGIVLYIPSAVAEISIASGSGSIDIRNYPNKVVIDSDTGEISIREVGGAIVVDSIESGIVLENCRGAIALRSKSGNIVVKKAPVTQTEEMALLESKSVGTLVVTEINIETDTGAVTLTGVSGDIDIETGIGNIVLERCRGKRINVESSGGDVTLRDIAGIISLKNEGGSVAVDDSSDAVSVESRDGKALLRNSDDAEIHIESDDGDVIIEDCYADIYVNSGIGNVLVSAGNISRDGMGRVELRMKTGDAYLHGRTFEDIYIVIEEGNAEINMDRLNPGGSGQINVYRGNVTVGVLPSFGCELTVHAPRKKMHVELPLEIVEKDKNRLCGTLNGGGTKMEVIAPNGEIRFHALAAPYPD